eukprot:scaffold25921_cov137-Cylindrotheca_fusiformis.AAC.4
MGRGVGRPTKSLPRADSDGESGSSGETPKTTAPFSYVAPQWLLEKPTRSYFSVPIAAASEQTRSAIEEQIARDGALHRPKKRSAKIIHHMRQLQHDLQSHRQKAKLQKEKLAAAIFAKKEKLKEMRRSRNLELGKWIDGLERKLREQQEHRNVKEEEKVRAQIMDDFQRRFSDEQKVKPKHQSEGQTTEGQENLAESPECDPTLPKKDEKELESDCIQRGIVEALSKTEKLTEMKSEMVWLLKQVIKAEMKQKLGSKESSS